MALGLKNSLIDDYFEVLEKYVWIEGNVAHMYLDTEGNVTVGRGHILVNSNNAAELPFTEGAQKSDPTVIRATYEQVKNRRNPNHKLTLSQENIDSLAKRDIEEKIKILKVKFTGFDRLPREVQKGLLEIWFNVKEAWRFVELGNAVRKGDWSRAAFESHRRTRLGANGIYPRNTLTAIWFCQAAVASEQEKEGTFCYKFKQKMQSEGWSTYDDLLIDLSKYQKKMSQEQNFKFLEKLKRIDQVFKPE